MTAPPHDAAPVQAILMAGGRGARLYPYTAVLPKPLVPVGDKPVLEMLLLHLRRHGIRRVVLAVNHLRHLIQSFFGDGSLLDMHITYAVEDAPLGTCGPIGAVLERMAPDFIVLNGDLLTDIDVTDFLAHHRAREGDATIAAAVRRHQFEYGVLDVDGEDRLVAYHEKPRSEHLVSMGLYALRRESIRDLVAPGVRRDMPDLLMDMVARGRRVLTWHKECLWLDIGQPEDYARAQALAESRAKDKPQDAG